MKFVKLSDIVLLFILIALPLYAVLNQDRWTTQRPQAVIEIDEERVYTLLLNQQKRLTLTEFNPPVILQIVQGKIRVRRNDCPKQICVSTGFIQKPGEMIVCVPKKMLIYIEKKQDDNNPEEIKAITQ